MHLSNTQFMELEADVEKRPRINMSYVWRGGIAMETGERLLPVVSWGGRVPAIQ